MLASMEAALYPVVVEINNYLSSYILIFLLVAVGLWYSVKTRFVQVRYFGEGMKKVFGNLSLRGGSQESGMSSFQALATAIAAGKVLVPIGLIAAVFSIAGHYLGAGMTIRNGAKIVRPVILVVLTLLAVKVIAELLGFA